MPPRKRIFKPRPRLLVVPVVKFGGKMNSVSIAFYVEREEIKMDEFS